MKNIAIILALALGLACFFGLVRLSILLSWEVKDLNLQCAKVREELAEAELECTRNRMRNAKSDEFTIKILLQQQEFFTSFQKAVWEKIDALQAKTVGN